MKISEATPSDFELLIQSTKRLSPGDTVATAAQKFVDLMYDHFQESLVLLRLFCSLPYGLLSEEDKRLVDQKAAASETTHLVTDATPVLTLLGTRGQREEWNNRAESQGFRCIPLISSGYVGSLSMLSMQFKVMKLDLKILDTWQDSVLAGKRADQYAGTLFVRDAGVDQDRQGRKIVPRQDFVAQNGVETALGFGAGYRNHPTIVTMFAFTNETLDRSAAEQFPVLLQRYLSLTEQALTEGRIF